MRLGDLDAIEKFIEDGLNNPDKLKAFGYDAIEIMSEVHYAPTIDAVAVVRCKDCKSYDVPEDGYGWCYEHDRSICADDFCSYGARKDGDGNG